MRIRKLHKGDCFALNNKCEKSRIHIIYVSGIILFGAPIF